VCTRLVQSMELAEPLCAIEQRTFPVDVEKYLLHEILLPQFCPGGILWPIFRIGRSVAAKKERQRFSVACLNTCDQ